MPIQGHGVLILSRRVSLRTITINTPACDDNLGVHLRVSSNGKLDVQCTALWPLSLLVITHKSQPDGSVFLRLSRTADGSFLTNSASCVGMLVKRTMMHEDGKCCHLYHIGPQSGDCVARTVPSNDRRILLSFDAQVRLSKRIAVPGILPVIVKLRDLPCFVRGCQMLTLCVLGRFLCLLNC